ncbi:neural/ectodermal development factor IMP-L2 [Culicoides brevitarsis]|uniref:neural/ectodermal development factor IMP-L2 n=1 Tax=Culicoides brevitarsis TaxID=469753 RepID=UPI00307B7BB3
MKVNQMLCILSWATIVMTCAYATTLEDEQNSLSSRQQKLEERNDFVKIVKAPALRISQPTGYSVELECEVVGSPAPVVQWVHGSGQYVNFDEFETNLISESDPTIMTTVKARLVIEHQIRSESTYTCVAKSGGKTAYASTTVHKGPRSLIKQQNLTDNFLYKTNLYGALKPVRITNFIKSILTLMGSNLILPCRTIGRPLADITWLDIDGNVIAGKDPRFKTLPTGELIISDLKWSDMGSYTCVAKNGLSKDTISTFIYPIKDD